MHTHKTHSHMNPQGNTPCCTCHSDGHWREHWYKPHHSIALLGCTCVHTPRNCSCHSAHSDNASCSRKAGPSPCSPEHCGICCSSLDHTVSLSLLCLPRTCSCFDLVHDGVMGCQQHSTDLPLHPPSSHDHLHHVKKLIGNYAGLQRS